MALFTPLTAEELAELEDREQTPAPSPVRDNSSGRLAVVKEAAVIKGCSRALIYKWLSEEKLTRHEDAEGRAAVDLDELDEMPLHEPPTTPRAALQRPSRVATALTPESFPRAVVARRSSDEAAHRLRVEGLLEQLVAELHTLKLLAMVQRRGESP